MNSTLLSRLIPMVLDNAFKFFKIIINLIYKLKRIAIDPIFPPPEFNLWSSAKKGTINEN